MSEPKTGTPGLTSFDLNGDLMPEPVGLGPQDTDLSDGLDAGTGEDVLGSGTARSDEALTRIAPDTGVRTSEMDGDAIGADDAVLLGDDDPAGADDDQLAGTGEGDVILGAAGAVVSDDADDTDGASELRALPEPERDDTGFAEPKADSAWVNQRATRLDDLRALSFGTGAVSV